MFAMDSIIHQAVQAAVTILILGTCYLFNQGQLWKRSEMFSALKQLLLSLSHLAMQAHLILLCFVLLLFTDTECFLFLQIKGLWQLALSKSVRTVFLNDICLLHVSPILVISTKFQIFQYYICYCDL